MSQTAPSVERAAKRPDGRGKHLWQALRRHAYQQTSRHKITRALTPFGEACATLWPWSAAAYPGIRDGLLATLCGRAAWQSIIDWRYGRRRAPQWAWSLLLSALERRRDEINHAIDIAKEKARD